MFSVLTAISWHDVADAKQILEIALVIYLAIRSRIPYRLQIKIVKRLM